MDTTFNQTKRLPLARRLSRSSSSSGGSRNSLSSARSATSNMTEHELDNFRSMRGKSAGNFLDSAYSMVDDVFDLDDRLSDFKGRKELQKRVFDATGEAYAILITATDVRLQHNDDRGHYHYNHFGSEKPAKTARDRGARRDPEQVKQRWHVVDDEATGHIFADISPRYVTIIHSTGVWCVCRIGGRVLELRDSLQHRPFSKRTPRPGGRDHSSVKLFKLHGRDDLERHTNQSAEPLLAANTPGQRDKNGLHPRAHRSYYHNL